MFASETIAETFLVMLHPSFTLALGALLIGGGSHCVEKSLCQRRRCVGGSSRAIEAMLPDSMWPLALAFAGLPAVRRLALCSKGMFRRHWQSADFWWQLLQNLGLNPMDIMSNHGVFSFAITASHWKLNNAAALVRERLLRRILIDEGLLSIALPAVSPSSQRRCRVREELPPRAAAAAGRHRQHASASKGTSAGPALVLSGDLGLKGRTTRLEVLQRARQAVMVLEKEDGEELLALASLALVAALRRRGGSAAESGEAETILDAVADRTNLFSTSQMLDILGAHQAAEADLFAGGIQDRSDDELCSSDA